MTDIRPNAPSIVQTRDKTAFLFTSRSNKSLRTATLVWPDTFTAIPARRPAYGRQACRSLKSFQTFTNVWVHACTAIVTTSAAKRCFATNALETFRTPYGMEEKSYSNKLEEVMHRNQHLFFFLHCHVWEIVI